MKRETSLNTWLFLWLLALGLGPVIVLLAGLLPSVLHAYQAVAEQQGLLVAQQRAGELTQRLERRRETVRAIARLPAPLEILNETGDGKGGLYLTASQAAERFATLTGRWFTPAGDLRTLSILDSNGEARFTASTTSDRLIRVQPSQTVSPELGDRFRQTMIHPPADPEATVLGRHTILRVFTPILSMSTAPVGMLVMDFSLTDVLGADLEARWLDSSGRLLHGTPVAGDALPADLRNKRLPAISHDGQGGTLAWVPLRLGSAPDDLIWVGTPVDHSHLWRRMVMLALAALVVFGLLVTALMLVVRHATKRLDTAKQDLMSGLNRMIRGERGIRFDWNGPTEIRALAKELNELGRLHADTVHALRLSRFSVEHAGEGILWVTRDSRLLFTNDTLCAMLGYTQEELLRLAVADLNPRYAVPEAWRQHWRHLAQMRTLVYESSLRRKDGSEMTVEIAANHMIFEGQEYDFAFIRDITERKLAAQKLEIAVEELSNSNAELERFAHVAAHDLQEPVRSVTSFAQLLERRLGDRLSQQDREILDFLVRGARRMHDLVQDLLAYTLTRDNRVPQTEADAERALDLALETVRPTIEATGAHIQRHPMPRVMGDTLQLSEVFRHLLSNALKFVRPGIQPQIRIDAQRTGDAWVFAIADNGIGIDPDYGDQLFILFRRLNGTRYPGTGLGLAVCKRLVEHHGGRIWLQSSPGQGTTVLFTFKAAPPRHEGGPTGNGSYLPLA